MKDILFEITKLQPSSALDWRRSGRRFAALDRRSITSGLYGPGAEPVSRTFGGSEWHRRPRSNAYRRGDGMMGQARPTRSSYQGTVGAGDGRGTGLGAEAEAGRGTGLGAEAEAGRGEGSEFL